MRTGAIRRHEDRHLRYCYGTNRNNGRLIGCFDEYGVWYMSGTIGFVYMQLMINVSFLLGDRNQSK